MDDINLIQQAQRHLLVPVVRELGEEIDLEIVAGDDKASFGNTTLVGVTPPEPTSSDEHDDGKNLIGSELPNEELDVTKNQPVKRKKKVVKRWREEWADTYKWAYVDMSALEEHNNSLLHKEAVRLQLASKEKAIVEKPIHVKALMSKTAGSIVEAAHKSDPHEVEYIQAVQEIVHALERLIAKNSVYVNMLERLLEPERTIIFRVRSGDLSFSYHTSSHERSRMRIGRRKS
ncbi:hypothetical protein MLD38_030229 [Melastoma candidum]|uniref:Uncharacterized protein n=1 Tax=Melastoma candidum TaxID=119954 RepID=A0ACB9ML47_9MYRT|nr:hypothetical protein MLD38_030229 [Melastoma candidum]